jgi:hypothetical protein
LVFIAQIHFGTHAAHFPILCRNRSSTQKMLFDLDEIDMSFDASLQDIVEDLNQSLPSFADMVSDGRVTITDKPPDHGGKTYANKYQKWLETSNFTELMSKPYDWFDAEAFEASDGATDPRHFVYEKRRRIILSKTKIKLCTFLRHFLLLCFSCSRVGWRPKPKKTREGPRRGRRCASRRQGRLFIC